MASKFSASADVPTEDGNTLELALVTANVGSLFEKPEELLEPWISCLTMRFAPPADSYSSGASNEVATAGQCGNIKLSVGKPSVLAVHLQEVGGKRFQSTMGLPREFVRKLTAALEPLGFSKHLGFIDDEQEKDKFTALGSIYYIHKSVACDVTVWNFKTAQFEPVVESHVHAQEDLDAVPAVHKHKFPSDITPNQRVSRKGFLRTRWKLAPQCPPIEFVNVHLFHDESNFVAMQQFPSMYSEGRRRALQYALDRIGADRDDDEPRPQDMAPPDAYFVFGDFNFRLDIGAVVSWLSEGAEIRETKDESGRLTRREFHHRTSIPGYSGRTTTTHTESCSWSTTGEFAATLLSIVPPLSAVSSEALDHQQSCVVADTAAPDDCGWQPGDASTVSLASEAAVTAEGQAVADSSAQGVDQVDRADSAASLRFNSDRCGKICDFEDCTSQAQTIQSQFEARSDSAESGVFRRVLTLEKKIFELHGEHTKTCFTSDLTRKTLLNHDREPDFFQEYLNEFEIGFPPSYPYTESTADARSFMGTRCPSWCDRVLFGLRTAEALNMRLLDYDLIGRDCCMGDHKPVLLRVRIARQAGGTIANSQWSTDAAATEDSRLQQPQEQRHRTSVAAVTTATATPTKVDLKANGKEHWCLIRDSTCTSKACDATIVPDERQLGLQTESPGGAATATMRSQDIFLSESKSSTVLGPSNSYSHTHIPIKSSLGDHLAEPVAPTAGGGCAAARGDSASPPRSRRTTKCCPKPKKCCVL